jgi:hypothetical protein
MAAAATATTARRSLAVASLVHAKTFDTRDACPRGWNARGRASEGYGARRSNRRAAASSYSANAFVT